MFLASARSERSAVRWGVNLAYRWFCGLSIEDKVPDRSAFSHARNERFRDSDIFRIVFERVVGARIGAGLVGGEGFAVDASLTRRIEAASPRCSGLITILSTSHFRVASDKWDAYQASSTFHASPSDFSKPRVITSAMSASYISTVKQRTPSRRRSR